MKEDDEVDTEGGGSAEGPNSREKRKKKSGERRWEVFPLQESAFEYGDRENERLMRSLEKKRQLRRREEEEDGGAKAITITTTTTIQASRPWWMEPSLMRFFSFEKNANGKRKFIVATWEDFWREYKALEARDRHHYEIIRDGSPCNLYFDLEYPKQQSDQQQQSSSSPTLASMVSILEEDLDNERLELFVGFVIHRLKALVGVDCPRNMVVDLDSSTPLKFSRHLVFRLPGAAFKSSSDVGAFVSCVVQDLYELLPYNPDLKPLFVVPSKKPDATHDDLFVDQSVYGRNRNFRMYLSSKFGKEWTLKPSSINKFEYADERELFYASLLCNVLPQAPVLVPPLSTLPSGDHTSLNQTTTATPSSIRLIQFAYDRPSLPNSSSSTSNDCLDRVDQHSRSSIRSPPDTIVSSSHPQLDDFIRSQINKGGVRGWIRSIASPSPGQLIYNISNNKWCENIGRAHKSNHIFLVVDLTKRVFYQKCLDPDCRNFRSNPRPIPDEVWPSNQAQSNSTNNDADDDLLIDDDVLVKAVNEFPDMFP
eukprot:TRINITY_DN2368_c0_g1_i2.p1 TRINITY_DN2368_c0_g1~~TRINITY_DN2368_c0_g1_i2.p1  ORF type:complete len:618 (+),score=173.73 TRINITY_DN2368_c0_g1_i2:244-1854(+)